MIGPTGSWKVFSYCLHVKKPSIDSQKPLMQNADDRKSEDRSRSWKKHQPFFKLRYLIADSTFFSWTQTRGSTRTGHRLAWEISPHGGTEEKWSAFGIARLRGRSLRPVAKDIPLGLEVFVKTSVICWKKDPWRKKYAITAPFFL